jgi:hypothetical protein
MKDSVEEVSAQLIHLGNDAHLEQIDNKYISVNVYIGECIKSLI